MKLGKRLQTVILSALITVWIIALFLAYLPISSWVAPTFPFTVDYQYKTMLLIVSTGMVSGSFFVKGIRLMQKTH